MWRWGIRIVVLVTLALAVGAYSMTRITAALDSQPSSSQFTLTVTKTGDTADGVCDGDCSI